MGVSQTLLLVLCTWCCLLSISEAANVTITDGVSLQQVLCHGTPSNMNLILSKPTLYMNFSDYCLVENTANLHISPADGIDQAYVTVYCSNPYGFGFLNVTNLTVNSVAFWGCENVISASALKYVDETNQFFYYDGIVRVSLFFSHCFNLKLYNVSAVAGMVGVNLCGESEIESVVLYNDLVFPPLKMLVYFTDTSLALPLKCNLSVKSNIISASGYLNISDFRAGPERIPIGIFSDFTLFLTQSFDVTVALHVGRQNRTIEGPLPPYVTNVLLAFINSMSSSHVTFQGLVSYQYCVQQEASVPSYNDSAEGLALYVAFYETPSFSGKANDTLHPLLIKNVSFVKYYAAIDNGKIGILEIVKFAGKLSHEVTLENVGWCDNDLVSNQDIYLSKYWLSPFHAQKTMLQATGQLHLKLTNILMHHNKFVAPGYRHKASNCLMCLTNVEAKMSGDNYFFDNAGGSVISVVASNLSVSGDLVVRDGYAIEGGGICLDASSFLFLKEPLTAEFSNNTADRGSALYAPTRSSDSFSAVQLVPSEVYSTSNVSSIDITLYFNNNGINGMFQRSFFAPHFSFFGQQQAQNFLFDSSTWDSSHSQFAYTTLIDSVLCMEEVDKFTSLSNGVCLQLHLEQWECGYIDQNVVNGSTGIQPQQCRHPILSTIVYPGQRALSVPYFDNQVYDTGYCYSVEYAVFRPYQYWNSSLQKDDSMLVFTFLYNDSIAKKLDDSYFVILYSNIEVDLFLIPILELHMVDTCPLGFCLNNEVCKCAHGLHDYDCFIDGPSFASPQFGFQWAGIDQDRSNSNSVKILLGSCPQEYCTTEEVEFQLDENLTDQFCIHNHAGVLCGSCRRGYSVVFGSDTCYSHCSDVYLLTLLVYALAGVLLVFVLFVLRLTVATGTINGVIFYANIFGLVMSKFIMYPGFGTFNPKGYYEKCTLVLVSLLNLDLGFPLCLYKGMTVAPKVGFQFVFPVYLWSIAIVLILLSKVSTRLTNLISASSVQVLATLFYFSFSKLLRTVIMVFSPASIQILSNCQDIYGTSKYVWYYDGQYDYGQGTHGVLLTLAVAFIAFFLFPYTLLITFSSCFMRFQIVNYFRPLIEAYGGPFRDKWRFWFGLRLWITILLFGANTLEGMFPWITDIACIVLILVFLILQGFLHPFKSTFIGLLDSFFVLVSWLLIETHFSLNYIGIVWSSIYDVAYVALTAAAAIGICLIIIFHICGLKYRDRFLNIIHQGEHARYPGYEAINNVDADSDVDLFQAAEDRAHEQDTY